MVALRVRIRLLSKRASRYLSGSFPPKWRENSFACRATSTRCSLCSSANTRLNKLLRQCSESSLCFAPIVLLLCCLYRTSGAGINTSSPNAVAVIANHQSCIIAFLGTGSAARINASLKSAVQPVTKLLTATWGNRLRSISRP